MALESTFLLRLSHGACLRNTPLPTHVEVAVHVEANDAEVVGSGNIRDDALSAPALFRHPHPHVPVPELQARKRMKVKRSGVGRGGSSPLPLPCQGTFSGVGHLGSSSSLYKDFLSTQPSPGMVSTRYSSAGSSAVCSYPWRWGGATVGGLSLVLIPMPQLTLSPGLTWSFQAEIQYRLSSSSSRWMDWLRKLREAGSKGSGKGKDKHSHTVMLEELEMGLRSHACVSRPLDPHCRHPSFLHSTPTPIPAILPLCSGFSPTFELTSPTELSQTPYCLPSWKAS